MKTMAGISRLKTALLLLALASCAAPAFAQSVGTTGNGPGFCCASGGGVTQTQVNNTAVGNDLSGTVSSATVNTAGKGSADYFNFAPGTAGSNAITLSPVGSDTSIGINFVPKGTGIDLFEGVSQFRSTPTWTTGSTGTLYFGDTNTYFTNVYNGNTTLYGAGNSMILGGSQQIQFATGSVSGIKWNIDGSGNFYPAGNSTENIGSATANAKAVYSSSYVTTPITDTPSATPTISAAYGMHIYTLAQNASPTITNLIAGEEVNFEICQPNGAVYTWTWPSNVHGGIAIGGTQNACSFQTLKSFNGTTLIGMNAGLTNVAP